MSKLKDLLNRARSPVSSSSRSTSSRSPPRTRDQPPASVHVPTTSSTRDNEKRPQDVSDRLRRLSIGSQGRTSTDEHRIPRKPVESSTASSPTYAEHKAAVQERLQGTLDLRNTVDTTVHEKMAPAVVHENIKVQHSHVEHKEITREIHTHDVFHRIQPIIDVQVLPAKHFVMGPDGKTKIEVAADQIPKHARDRANWVIAETVSGAKSRDNFPIEKFTARTFGDEDDDVPEYVDSAGVKRSKQTWIHPPTLEEGGKNSGQTVPFHFGSDRDGFRP